MALFRIPRGSSLSQSISKLSGETTIVPHSGSSVSNNARQVRVFTLIPGGTKNSIQHFSNNTILQSRGISGIPQLQHPSAQVALDYPDCESEEEKVIPELGPTKEFEKPRVVVLGTGWGACRFLKDIDTKTFDVVCISPRNHMVFTPLLASTCVGTLEFRSVAEPVNQIQTALAQSPGSHFFLANCTAIDTDKHEVGSLLQEKMKKNNNSAMKDL
jgi:NADH:ubiquinone reductase (non-electrogenic)